MMCVCVHTHIYIFIAQQIISCGSHWIKLIMWYKIGRWILDDICCLIWYASSDFVCKRWRPRNKQAFKLNFKSAMENKRILFVEVSDGENKKLVDNSTQTNTKKIHKMQEQSMRSCLEKLFKGLCLGFRGNHCLLRQCCFVWSEIVDSYKILNHIWKLLQ